MAKIVVVEDEAALRSMIVEELEDLGHEVHSAPDGEAGLALIGEVQPKIICCDINMPKMNGFQLKATLQEQSVVGDDTVFIFISANSSKNDIADGLMLGADHYFTKPIDFDRLAKIVGEG
jgi:DNA-binding response OmpR family regulator